MSDLLSDKKKLENYKLGLESYNKAKRKTGTTLTRWSPDWEQASRYYRDAIQYYRISGNNLTNNELLLCYKESAIAHEACNSIHTAAQHYEYAAELLSKQNDNINDNIQEIYRLYTEASRCYRLNGSIDQSAKSYVKAGESINDHNTELALQCYMSACSIYEDENRGELSDHTFKRCIIFSVQSKRYDDAIAIIKRQNHIYNEHIQTFENDLYRNYLTIIVLRLYTNQLQRGIQELQEYENNERFNRSKEYVTAQALVDIYQSQDNDALNNLLKTNTSLKFLLPPIASIAKKLKIDNNNSSNSNDYDELTGATTTTTTTTKPTNNASRTATKQSTTFNNNKSLNNNNNTVKASLLAKSKSKYQSSSDSDDGGSDSDLT